MAQNVVLIGYSGHGFVVADILIQSGNKIAGYCEIEEKKINPFHLKYFGVQTDEAVKKVLNKYALFVAVGNNEIRKKIQLNLVDEFEMAQAIHPSAIVATHVEIGNGTMLSANVVVNSCATIGNGVILNTGCIIEHECTIAAFVHIAPSAVLCGNVSVGEGSFIGAHAVIKQGITIGKNCVIGAGAVVLNEILDGKTVFGNPAK